MKFDHKEFCIDKVLDAVEEKSIYIKEKSKNKKKKKKKK